MGDKTAARKLAISCDVPIVPGTNTALNTVDEARAFAADAGYPVMLKAAMGGGGRGMRVVRSCAPSYLSPIAETFTVLRETIWMQQRHLRPGRVALASRVLGCTAQSMQTGEC